MKSTPAAPDRYLTEAEVSELTGLALQTLRNWRHLRRGPSYVRPGGRAIRYPLAAVLKFMQAGLVEPEPCTCSGRCPEGDRA